MPVMGGSRFCLVADRGSGCSGEWYAGPLWECWSAFWEFGLSISS